MKRKSKRYDMWQISEDQTYMKYDIDLIKAVRNNNDRFIYSKYHMVGDQSDMERRKIIKI